jgi:predicted dehydrogenase
VEKPFAASLADADRMIAALAKTGKQLLVNWPLAWYPPHVTSKRLIDEGLIGEICEVHYYDGNRGPTRHLMDKVETGEQEALQKIKTTWWYRKSEGGGSLLDYLGYGVTLGTWYHGGDAPEEVMTTTWARPGLEVDEHSVSVCRYARGLSKYETRWGTFTDPWLMQPQPQTGFVLVGTLGTISSYDYATSVRVQTRQKPEGYELPVDAPLPGMTGPIEHFIDVLENGAPVHGPLSLPICRTGQRIVDAAILSAELRSPVRLQAIA